MQRGERTTRSVEYLQRLDIDVWVVRGSDRLSERSTVEESSSHEPSPVAAARPRPSTKRGPVSRPQEDRPRQTRQRVDQSETTDDLESFRCHWFRCGKTVIIGNVRPDKRHKLLVDIADFLDGYGPHAEPESGLLEFPPPRRGGKPCSGTPAKPVRADKFVSDYAKAKFPGLRWLVAVGPVAGRVASSINGDFARIDLEELPLDRKGKMKVWRLLASLQ